MIVYDSATDETFRATWSTASIASELRRYGLRIGLLTLVIGLFIIAPLYWFLHRQIIYPLRRLSYHLAQVSEDPSQILEPLSMTGTASEITQISAALEELTEAVRRALRQKERLADIGEATAKINHDLRNILVSATLVTDTLASSDDPKIQRIAPHIERAISDAAAMTQNMMDYLTEPKPEDLLEFTLDQMAENLSHDTNLQVTTQGPHSLSGMPSALAHNP